MFHWWTEFDFTFRKTDEMIASWQENTEQGFTITVAVLGPLMVMISLIPSFYHILLKMRRNNKKNKLKTQNSNLDTSSGDNSDNREAFSPPDAPDALTASQPFYNNIN